MESLVKILFPTPLSPRGNEMVVAQRIGVGKFILTEAPVYVSDIACADVVHADWFGDILISSIDQVVDRGGHSTIRAKLSPVYAMSLMKGGRASKIFKMLILATGCNAYLSDSDLSIDIPLNADQVKLFAYLNKLKIKGRLFHHEFSHIYVPPRGTLH